MAPRQVNMSDMFGLLNIYKPRGISSYDVIRRLKPLLDRDEKIGHAGTLDPAAEGVLVICLGSATRLAQWVQAYPKRYLTAVQLGATSTTDDSTGEIGPVSVERPPSPEQVEEAARKFVGRIEQVPPAHSAVKLQGQRAYRLARRGHTLQLKPRPVEIYSLRILEYEYPRLRLELQCTSGTYVRSLARDIGWALGTGGYCAEIIRTAIGPFLAEQALKLDQITASDVRPHLIPPSAAIPEAYHVVIPDSQVGFLARGRPVAMPNLPQAQVQADELAAVDSQGALLALVKHDQGNLKPVKVFLRK